MQEEKKKKETSTLISDSFGNTKEKGTNEIAFRRWLIRELDSGRITEGEALERFNLNPISIHSQIRTWRIKYSSEIPLTLPIMTEKERLKADALQKRLKELEKHLEHAQMKNAALETLIDIAEEQLKITIRKKSGPKQ
jgi:hypothetical protein